MLIFFGWNEKWESDTFPQSFKLTTCSGPFRGNLFIYFFLFLIPFSCSFFQQQSNKVCKTFIVTWIHVVCTSRLMNLFFALVWMDGEGEREAAF
jgi:hypothetical protein